MADHAQSPEPAGHGGGRNGLTAVANADLIDYRLASRRSPLSLSSVLQSGRAILYLAVVGLLLAAVGALGARLFWGFELLCHASFYFFFTAIACVIACAVLREKRLGLAAFTLAAFFGLGVVPYFISTARAEVNPEGGGRQVRVVLFNVLNSNREYADVREYLEAVDADLLIVQEFDPKWRRNLAALEEHYPHREQAVRRGAFGMAVFSKFPLREARWHVDHSEHYPIFSGTVEIGEKRVTLTALHPPPPVRQRSARARNEILSLVPTMIPDDGSRLLVGDLNCTPWSPHFRELCRATGLRDSALGHGVQATWFPRSLPIGIPIDHVLISKDIAIQNREVGPYLGSDHRPVVVDLVF